ncbi:MAG: N-acetylmuramoyl-L-alanine amidase [Sporomusaceae bacterium]|jgi:N-acetylmuramoyl-L-alanine amidase|nr:N-acetylmuramoyl-L-alanine amidase [Sporomusaceae bacterium]
MRILSIKRRAVKVVFFLVALAALQIVFFEFFLKSGKVAEVQDLAHIERAALSQTSLNFENVDLKYLSGRVIAIDPGHGGVDNGAGAFGRKEKDLNLKIAVKLAAELRQNNATVILTRAEDLDYYTRGKGGKRNDLLKRSEIIETSGAEVFVSIHCNSTYNSSWVGAQVFYNAAVAENRELAEIIQQSLKNFPVGNKRQAKQDSNIFLLKSTKVPGVLVEAGFMSNRKEARSLSEEEYQKSIAASIVKALAYYFGRNEMR